MPSSTPQSASSNSITLPRWTVHFQALLLGVVATTFFLFGMLVGSQSSTNNSTIANQSSELAYDCRVSGRLMTKTDAGQAPAIGGVVFALPRDRFPTTPLPSAGVTPNDFQPLDNQTIAAIHDLGGAVSRVDDNGQFDLLVDGGRGYLLLGVATSTRGGQAVSGSEMQLLNRFFVPAQKLTAGSQTVWKKFSADEDYLDLATLLVQ